MAVIIDGKAFAEKITEELKQKISRMTKKPHLAVIQVGNNSASSIYVNLKRKKAEEIGIKSTVINLENTISEQELINEINKLNDNNDVNAILVQLPLPAHICTDNIIKSISPNKDVDGFHK